ncbi:MAG: hypothetical protein JO342_19390 [Solirubrobacterales bacterium]|nr:hypothetical protein [Solirubrobacterales bacterium]MBV9168308.1 hypothetical protein [Solirubrobacterales bacterium]
MARFDHIRWVGGGPGAGKTTVACRLAEHRGLSIYAADAAIGVHASRLSASAAPLLDRFRLMSMDERWVLRKPGEMFRTFPWFHGEGFDLLIDELGSLPTDRITLVEGFRLLPHLVAPLLSEPTHAVWLIPTPRFRRAAFAARGEPAAFWLRTTDPQRALANLLARDELFTEAIAADAARNKLMTTSVDGKQSVDAIVTAVAKQFGL